MPISDCQLIERRVPNSRIVSIDRCGHFPMYEQAQQYLDAVSAFLAE